MKPCNFCGHDEFVAVIPNVVVNITALGIDDANLSDCDVEFEWRHEYLDEDYGGLNDVTIKCKACERVSTRSIEDLGLQQTEEDMVPAYGID